MFNNSQNQIFQYNGSPISFQKGDSVAVLSTSAHETSKIQIFNHPKFGRIRTATLEDGTIVLCLSDIAKALGYSNPAKAVIDHCKKGVTVLGTPTVNQYGTTVMQPMKYGVEGCMNKLIMKSQLPDAEKFQDWVCYDVLPTIRKTGSYSIQPQHNIPQTYSDALLLAANQAKRIESLEAENHQLLLERNSYLEKIEFADNIMQARNCITIADMANILCQNKIFSKGCNGLTYVSTKTKVVAPPIIHKILCGFFCISWNVCIFAVLNIIKYHPMRAKLAFIAGIFYACILKY